MSASQEWADQAVKLRFGPNATTASRPQREASTGDSGLPSCVVLLNGAVLAEAGTWEEVVKTAIEENHDLPQPPLVVFPRSKPEGDEFIEEFCGAMRQRDLTTEFILWYGEKGDKNPESWPRSLSRGEWLEQLGTFIAGLDE